MFCIYLYFSFLKFLLYVSQHMWWGYSLTDIMTNAIFIVIFFTLNGQDLNPEV